MNENKLKTIRNWSSLQTIHDVRLFLNFCFYYRRFIEDFAMICDFLYDLIKTTKNHKFKFVIMIFITRNVFELIKNIMCFDKILVQFDIFLFFIIETDVSNFKWKTMLYQVKSNDIERSIVFESKTFSFVERNYSIHEREFLVIKKTFKKWRCYVENELTTMIRTNHVDLQYFKFIVNSSNRLIRWLTEFDEFNFDIKYKFDSKMIVSNIFNRRNDYRLRFLQINFHTMTFDEIVIAYAKNETLFEKFNEMQSWKNININSNWMTRINLIIKIIRQIFEFLTRNFERVSTSSIRFTKRTIIVFMKRCSTSFVWKNDDLIWKKI